jgi:hypothetical protein
MIQDMLNGCYQERHPNTSVREAETLMTIGEANYDREQKRTTLAWIAAHPASFFHLTIARFWQFWFPALETIPPMLGRAETGYFPTPDFMQEWIRHQNALVYSIWLATALSIPGILLMLRRSQPVSVFVVGALAVYPLLYYVVVSDIRYRYPVLWISLLPAGYFLTWAVDRARSMQSHGIASSAAEA